MEHKEGYIEIVYNIAVILNESGLLRNTYSNIVPNLMTVMRSEETVKSRFRNRYYFTSFTRNNINELFDENSLNYLFNFDALFVCTNSTNDNEVLDRISDNKVLIEKYINDGHGLFMGSQKRLSEKKEVVHFLPDAISFRYIIRPEQKSSEGEICVFDKASVLVKDTSAEEINSICHNNRFKDHLYRSYIVPNFDEMFDDILVDKDDNRRKLLVRVRSQKVVFSTISLDYEEQNTLLKNIILYITEGVSHIGFFCNINKGEFDFSDKFNSILLDAKLNKLQITIYDSLSITPSVLDKSIYVISPYFTMEEVRDFWHQVQKDAPITDTNLKKLVYVNDSDLTENIFTEFRNYNEMDVKLHYALQWVGETLAINTEKKNIKEKAKADNKEVKWGTSFWETYDTMVFFYETYKAYGDKYINVLSSYGSAFLEQHLSHYRSSGQEELGSYDGMLNCSCALLEMFELFDLSSLQKQNNDFIKYNEEETLNYIKQYIANDDYLADMEMVIISLCNIKRYEVSNNLAYLYEKKDELNYLQILMKKVVEKLLAKYDSFFHTSFSITESKDAIDLQELSKDIEIIGLAIGEYSDIFSSKEIESLKKILFLLLLKLKYSQTSGYWINPIRTAAVLKSITKIVCISKVRQTGGAVISSVVSQIITEAFNYITKEMNRNKDDNNRVWLKDLMATVTIAYCICLYNSQTRNIAVDIEKTILESDDNITSIQVIDKAAIELTKMRTLVSEYYLSLDLINKEKVQAEHIIEEQKRAYSDLQQQYNSDLQKERNRFKKRRTTLVLTIVALAVLVIESIIIMVQEGLFNKFGAWMWSLVTTIIAFGVSILLKNIIEKRLFPTDEKLFEKKKKHNRKK